jgi:Domain of unknown function (DUF4326)
MTAPARVRLLRTKGFRLQQQHPGAIVIRRPTPWGNPFIVSECLEDDPALTEFEARERCTNLFDLWLEGDLELTDPLRIAQREWIFGNLPRLAGHDLACTDRCPSCCGLPTVAPSLWAVRGDVLVVTYRCPTCRHDWPARWDVNTCGGAA